MIVVVGRAVRGGWNIFADYSCMPAMLVVAAVATIAAVAAAFFLLLFPLFFSFFFPRCFNFEGR